MAAGSAVAATPTRGVSGLIVAIIVLALLIPSVYGVFMYGVCIYNVVDVHLTRVGDGVDFLVIDSDRTPLVTGVTLDHVHHWWNFGGHDLDFIIKRQPTEDERRFLSPGLTVKMFASKKDGTIKRVSLEEEGATRIEVDYGTPVTPGPPIPPTPTMRP